MKKNKRTIFISLLLLLLPWSVSAQDIQAVFSGDPLFQNYNLLPGESVEATADIYNLSGEKKQVSLEAVNVSNDQLSSVLDFIIKKQSTVLWSGSLDYFFAQGEAPLFTLDPHQNQTITLQILFKGEAGNQYQGKFLNNFDLVFGFLGEQTNKITISGSSGGSEASSLDIYDIRHSSEEGSVRIAWRTNLKSTSQVFYAPKEFGPVFDPDDSKYGYQYSSELSDESPGSLSHQIILSDLEECTEYYYRAVSTKDARETTSGELFFQTACPEFVEDTLPSGTDHDTPSEPQEPGEVLGDSDQKGAAVGGQIFEIKEEKDSTKSSFQVTDPGQVAGDQDQLGGMTEDEPRSEGWFTFCPLPLWLCALLSFLVLVVIVRVLLLFKKRKNG